MESKKLKGYQGLFLDEKTQEKLVELQKNGLSDITKDMHITFKFGETEQYPEELIGKEFNVKIIGYASDGKNSGFQVELPEELKPYYKNQNGPHITVSLGEVDGIKGKAVDTGTLNFEPIEEPFEISSKLGYFVYGKGKVMDNSIFDKMKEEQSKAKAEEYIKIVKEKLEETKTVVTHFGDDLDNKSAIYAIEKWAKEQGILKEDESLQVDRVPAGKIKEGMLNVDTGGHKGSRQEDGTIVIDGDPANGVKSASEELNNLGFYVPEQIVELADTVPNKVSALDSRSGLALIRYLSGEQAFKLAEARLLDKSLTDEQIREFGLEEAHEKQQGIIDNAVEKIEKYTKELPNGKKIVLAPEQIIAGSMIAYEKGIPYYASASNHLDKDKNVDGVTFAITSKPGTKLPEEILEYGKELVEQYRIDENTSGVFVNPNGQMVVAGGFKNPTFKIPNETIEGMLNKIEAKFMGKDLEKEEEQAEY